MSNEQEFSVQLNAFGNIDTAYYLDQAKQQRGEVVVAMFAVLAESVKKVLSYSRSSHREVPAYSL